MVEEVNLTKIYVVSIPINVTCTPNTTIIC
jgi:hypothetical protein